MKPTTAWEFEFESPPTEVAEFTYEERKPQNTIPWLQAGLNPDVFLQSTHPRPQASDLAPQDLPVALQLEGLAALSDL